ncbi:N-acetylmuramic acid 6-phosphate etherase [bacterium]|nr:N-acetylmuramic acid 6-phosphate etherase [bacterium]
MESDTKLVLGVEGGGTKTDWIYLKYRDSNTELVNNGQLPPSNLKLTSESQLEWMFEHLPQEATHVGIFLAGCVNQQDRNYLLRLANESWPAAAIQAGSDRDSGLAAAFGSEDGITVISGTGSAVTGRRDGRIEKAAGRGHLLGDRGGAYVICMEGLRLALRTYDLEHRTSMLAQQIMRDLALTQMEDLINWVQAADKTSISRLAPVMFEAALNGDREMLAVIEAGASALAKYTESVARWLNFQSPEVKLLGGIFLNHPKYVDLYKNALDPLLPANVSICHTPGSFGAAWLAVKNEFALDLSQAKEISRSDQKELARASTEQQNPRSRNLENLETKDLVRLLIEEEAYVANALQACSVGLEKAVDLAVDVFEKGGRMFYTGAGTSGRLGVLDASEVPPTFGESPERVQGIIAGGVTALYKSVEGAEDDPIQGALAIRQRAVTAQDLVCGITASGRTPFVLGSLQEARTIGAKTILITCNPMRNREEHWDVEIDLPTGPELVTGSTRMKAGTATKVTLNILTTCSMIKLGRTHGSWMVDLKPVNAKLRYRMVRLVSHLKNVSPDQAEKLLEAAGWNIRRALS